MCVVDSMGVRFFVEVHTEIKSKCVHMVRCSYVGRFEVRTHGMTFFGGCSRGYFSFDYTGL